MVVLTCLKELVKRSQFRCLLHQRTISALAQCRARRRIAIASSRCRQRQRRAWAFWLTRPPSPVQLRSKFELSLVQRRRLLV